MTDAAAASKFYITTPIYYVNARPHLGHAYTTIVCDAIARRKRMLGVDTWFLTGTDEHGQKIERSAAEAGLTPKKLVDHISAEYKSLWKRMEISNDDFIRTTDERHQRGVQQMFLLLKKNGCIYKGKYVGQYCVFDELYVDSAGPGAPCPVCGRPTETVSEENYYFKLSAFADKLLKLYTENPAMIRPESRRNEVLAFVRSGLRDLSISRTSIKWGIPVPDDPKHVIYVWLDALCNYITAVGYGSDAEKDKKQFAHYWPADVHMIGKEIVRFHCVYWPAFLMAAGLPLPKSLIAHGWLLFEQDKMSKSRGNIVRAETILDVMGNDALRYFLLREIAFGQDGSFSFDALLQRYNADLANDLGNLSSRTLTMIGRYFRGEVPYPSRTAQRTSAEDSIASLAARTIADFNALFDDYQFSRAVETAWNLIGAVNKYLVEAEPWAVAEKEDESSRARVATILYTAAEALRIVTALAHPIIPQATARIWAQLGLGDIRNLKLNDLQWGQLQLGTKLGTIEPVFPRADKSAIERMKQMEEQHHGSGSSEEKAPATQSAGSSGQAAKQALAPAASAPASVAAPATNNSSGDNNKIGIEDFTKIELRVGQVKTAEKVKGADKLLRLEVDIGAEVRQIVAGIAEAYTPENLIGRKVVIVANLAPRKLRGIESNGMLVAASLGEQGKPVLAGFLEDVPIGARLK
ncbi:MAG TPA: methionine--tRNA ligase [Terriglobales bacterium]|jgi:methionyl-tRNA synthetase|nr:methionine--tRNA ligase [Terriglobales bacterium]